MDAMQKYSHNARAVARDVVDTLSEHKKVNFKKIISHRGYAPSTAIGNARSIRRSKAYQDEISGFVGKLERHREKIIAAMEKKDLNEEQYRTLADAQTKITHDIQLLSGGKTENIGMEEDRNILLAIVADIQHHGRTGENEMPRSA